jgi:hypothetical protein
VLVTSRLRPGLPSLRRASEAARIRAAIAMANLAPQASECAQGATGAKGSPASGSARGAAESVALFQVVHHSIQSNHLHLIVEATDRAALSSGMRRLLIRIARGLNGLWERAGSVFADRFHERELCTPREVRNALVYVLQNLRKHGIALAGPDPFSSGPGFDGWRAAAGAARAVGAGAGAALAQRGGNAERGPSTFLRAARVEVPNPKTWLLGSGWMRHGLIDPSERPRSGHR